MMHILYHYTDSVRLPWILHAGELQPGRNKIGGFPSPDFLWATTDAIGDCSASSMSGDAAAEAYHAGETLQVRFTLHRDDFQPWREIVRAHPGWTPQQIERLERAAKGKSLPANWWCRVEPLPDTRWGAIEVCSYLMPAWKPLGNINGITDPTDDSVLGLHIGSRVYLSKQTEGANGARNYQTVMRLASVLASTASGGLT